MTVDVATLAYAFIYVVEGGGSYRVAVDQWDELDAAYHAWVERRIDRVLSLVAIDGEEILIAASRISDLARCTPGARSRMREILEQEKAEQGFAE